MLLFKLPRFLGSARWDGLQWGNEWPGSVTSFGRGRPGAPEPGGGSVTGGRWKVWRELPSGVLAWGVGFARSPRRGISLGFCPGSGLLLTLFDLWPVWPDHFGRVSGQIRTQLGLWVGCLPACAAMAMPGVFHLRFSFDPGRS